MNHREPYVHYFRLQENEIVSMLISSRLQTRTLSFRDPIVLSGRSRHLVPKALSVSVATVRSWYFDPKTGRWRWPVNGADLVYPGIYLGDA